MIRRKRMKKARYNGAYFYLEQNETTGGRRIITHEFPYAEFPATEDLGKKTKQWNILGFLFGPLYKEDADALQKALDQDGIGVLDHPYLGMGKQVRCLNYRIGEFNRDLGFVQFAMTFCEAGTPPDGPKILDGDQGLLNESLTEKAFSILKKASRGLADSAESINAFTERLEDKAAPFLSLRDSVDQMTASLMSLKDATRDLISEPANFYHSLVNVLDVFVKSPGSVLTVIEAVNFSLDPFMILFPGSGTEVVVTPFPSQLQSETITANHALAAITLVSMSDVTLIPELQNSQEKEKTKEIFFDRCEQFLELVLDLELFAIIQELRAATFRNIQLKESVLRVRTITVPAPTNSLLLAYQLFGDALDEEKLHLLNSFEDPGQILQGTAVEVIQ